MPTIPTHHSIGDTGHTTDHNSIVDVLTNHESRVAGLEAEQSGYLLNTGQNTVNVANPSGYAEHVVIPSGSRDGAVFIQSVTYGGKRTFALDTFGHTRASAVNASSTPLEVAGFDATQSSDLQRWRQSDGGTILARVGFDGTIYAPNITPGVWTTLTLSSGLVANTSAGAVPSYRLVGDMVQLKGNIAKSDGTGFSSSPITLGSLPSGFRPAALTYTIIATNFASGYAWGRLQIGSDGSMQMYFASGSFNPTWCSLDTVAFSRT